MALLTPRQEEVLSLLAEGKTNRDISSELGIQTATVTAMLYAIFNRIGVDNRVAAARWFWERSQTEGAA